MQNDNNTTYNTYLQVQNELQSAVNELRDELALEKFGMLYSQMEDIYDRNKEDSKTLEKITAVRAVYPQRISKRSHATQAPTITDMGKFRKGGKREMGAISTASLPDIVFMLLFFFMVATVLRTEEEKVRVIRPEASELYKIEKKHLIRYVNVVLPWTSVTARNLVIERSILNSAVIQEWIAKERYCGSRAKQDVGVPQSGPRHQWVWSPR